MKDSINRDSIITSAFMMEGLTEIGYDNVRKAFQDYGGAYELLSEMTDYVGFVCEMYDKGIKLADGLQGVFDYEVSSPFGAWFGRQIIANNGVVPSEKDARDFIVSATAEFFEIDKNKLLFVERRKKDRQNPSSASNLFGENFVESLRDRDGVTVENEVSSKGIDCSYVEDDQWLSRGAIMNIDELENTLRQHPNYVKPGVLLDIECDAEFIEGTFFDCWSPTGDDESPEYPFKSREAMEIAESVLDQWSKSLAIPEISSRAIADSFSEMNFNQAYLAAGVSREGYPAVLCRALDRIIDAGFAVYQSDTRIDIFRMSDVDMESAEIIPRGIAKGVLGWTPSSSLRKFKN